MRHLASLCVVAVVAVGCTDDRPSLATAPEEYQLSLHRGGHGARERDNTFLTGAQEVPPRITPARGFAVLRVARDAQSLDYRLFAFHITNVVQAHIHLGPAGANGPVVAFLYGLLPPQDFNGRVARGTITGADLVGPLAGQPFSVLLDSIRTGRTYVNVHTNDNVAPANTGPGDFPGGEIRGQVDLRRHGHHGHDSDSDSDGGPGKNH